MKHKIFFVILLSVNTTACSNCPNIEGQYTTSGGSEQLSELILLTNKTFILKHEAWQPGGYINKKTTKNTGDWACTKNKLTLEFSQFTYDAEYIQIGNNPLSINKKTMVIHFMPISDKSNDSLNNEIFYPLSSLQD